MTVPQELNLFKQESMFAPCRAGISYDSTHRSPKSPANLVARDPNSYAIAVAD